MLKTYWWETPKRLIPNFGDQLNPYLIEKITGKKPENRPPSPEYTTLLGIGSVLGLFPEQLKYCIIWGSGFGKRPLRIKMLIKRIKIAVPKKICAVRGPLTRNVFLKHKISCPEIYGDPALLMPHFFDPKIPQKYEIGIIPHYIDINHPWVQENRGNGILIIDIRQDVESFIEKVISCKKVISSSLHGLIIADAYKVPSVWIILNRNLQKQSFKFHDYFYSLKQYGEKPAIIRCKDKPIKNLVKNAHTRKISLDIERLLDVCPLISNITA